MDDITLVRKYLSKIDRAAREKIEFKLSILSFKNLMSAKRCGYTGIVMTDPKSGGLPRQTDRTIDRIDNNRGYVSGNVVAVCHAANQLKSVLENPMVPINVDLALLAVGIILDRRGI